MVHRFSLFSVLPATILGLSIGLSLGQYPSANAGSVLTLDQFIGQVRGGNSGVKASTAASEGGMLRSEEGKLLISPTVFANFTVTKDAKIQQVNLLGYDSLVTQNYSLGVSQLTTFGLQAKLSYDMMVMSYVNPVSLISIPGVPSLVPSSYANASPVLELTQSFWTNGFGRSTKATQEQVEANALSSSYNSSFQAKSSLSQAEMTYWRLALARQIVTIQIEALDRAKKIYEWNQRRARLHLGEESDLLQAEALLQSRELDLLSSRNEERAASREFNSVRNKDSELLVEEILVQLDPKMTDQINLPKREGVREDIKAAEQLSRAARATAIINQDRDQPKFDLYALLALNGQPAASQGIPGGYKGAEYLGTSVSNSLTFNRPTATVGIRFSSPFDFGLASKSRQGWSQEHTAAELTLDRKQFEQEQSWKELNESFQESTKHLNLSKKLEQIQENKLKSERDRLLKGRTTTYQVLLFEQDFLQAQLMRVRDQAKILTTIAQMKLFGGPL